MLILSGRAEAPVAYKGPLSTELAPGLRIGWVIADPQMIEATVIAKQGFDMSSAGLSPRIALNARAQGQVDGLPPDVVAL